jgi:hypothetical protein
VAASAVANAAAKERAERRTMAARMLLVPTPPSASYVRVKPPSVADFHRQQSGRRQR